MSVARSCAPVLTLALLAGFPHAVGAFGVERRSPRWARGMTVTFTLNMAHAPSTLSSEQVAEAIRRALTPWMQVDTADLSLALGPVIDDPAKTTPQADGVSMIFWTAGGPPRGDTFAGKAYPFDSECDILLEPRPPFTLIDLQAIVLHEVGHCLGLKHSAAEGVMKKFQGRPSLGHDDAVALSLLYPRPTNALHRATATLRGRLVREGKPLLGAVLRVIDGRTRRIVVAGFSGLIDDQRRTDAFGHFELPGLPPGQHELVVEPMNAFVAADPEGYGAPVPHAPEPFQPITMVLPALEAGNVHDVGTVDVAAQR